MQATTAQRPPTVVPPKVVPPHAVPARRPWNTLELLKWGLYLLWALLALFLSVVIMGVWEHRASLKSIGRDTAPSIIAAQKIRSSLAGMDANVANELLGGIPTANSLRAFEAGRESTANAIIDAAENITFGDREKRPIQRLQIGLGKYEELVQQARDLHARKDPLTVKVYLESAKVMDDELLKAADELDQANKVELDKAYARAGSGSIGSRSGIAIIGLVLILAMLRIQVFLTRRTRRVFNPALVLATVIAVVFLLHTLNALSRESEELKIAKEDAFNSMDALWRARSIGFAANADISRELLDDAHGEVHRAAFIEKSNLLAKSERGKSLNDFVKSALLHNRTSGYSGYLVDELNNVTFPGEAEAASDMLLAFGKYSALVDTIFANRTGKPEDAVARWTTVQRADVNAAFRDFDRALGRTLEINEINFKDSVDRGTLALARFEGKCLFVGLLLAALIYFGLSQRIREYL